MWQYFAGTRIKTWYISKLSKFVGFQREKYVSATNIWAFRKRFSLTTKREGVKALVVRPKKMAASFSRLTIRREKVPCFLKHSSRSWPSFPFYTITGAEQRDYKDCDMIIQIINQSSTSKLSIYSQNWWLDPLLCQEQKYNICLNNLYCPLFISLRTSIYVYTDNVLIKMEKWSLFKLCSNRTVCIYLIVLNEIWMWSKSIHWAKNNPPPLSKKFVLQKKYHKKELKCQKMRGANCAMHSKIRILAYLLWLDMFV